MAKLIEITDNGLVYMSENEIYQAVVNAYKSVDPNTNLDPSTPDGYLAAWNAEQLRIAVEAIIVAYNSKDPAKARGTNLNIIGSLTGSTREDGTASIINVTVSGTEDVVVLAGSVISGSETWSWTIDEDITIGAIGTGTGTATCSIVGDTEPEINTVTTVRTVIGGWSGVTNTGLVYLGTSAQSNEQFRVERSKSVSLPGNNQVDSTISAIYAVEDVTRVAGFENPTESSAVSPDNPYGLPNNSVSYLAYGGNSSDIAKAIFSDKNPGVYLNSAGTPESILVTSDKHPSNSMYIRFGRPIDVDMTLIVELSDPKSSLPQILNHLYKRLLFYMLTANL